jgi:hypothetical protein
MATATSVGTFLERFADSLADYVSPSGAAVFTGPVDHLSAGQEAFVFAVEETRANYSYRTLPHIEVFEEYQVGGRVWVVRAGGGEEVIRAARRRAEEMLGEVASLLRDSNQTTASTLTALGVEDARLSSWALTQYAIDGARDCRIAFTIDCTARFTPE